MSLIYKLTKGDVCGMIPKSLVHGRRFSILLNRTEPIYAFKYIKISEMLF